MQLTVNDLARMMDLSVVKTDSDLDAVRRLADQARQLNCCCAYVLPCYVSRLSALLDDAPDVLVGAAVGFPTGAHATAIKAAEARQCVADGAGELDMVINVGMLRSGEYDFVEQDIKAVIDAADGTLLKVILETHYLTDDEIRRGSEICVRAGADFVKTGTGWPETGATLQNIALIKSVVGDDAKVKASGGVRDLETLLDMYRLGASRFGVNMQAGVRILQQCGALSGAAVEV
jgi:deoxyribose-phosphate aldolase